MCGFSNQAEFQQARRQWVDQALQGALPMHNARWTEALAVGSQAFVEKIKGRLGPKALHRALERGWMGRMRYENLVKLTAAILLSEMML